MTRPPPASGDFGAAVRRLRRHLFHRDVAPLRTPLLAYLRRLAGDGAEDLLQETLLRGYRRVAQLTGAPRDAGAYLFRVARNLAIDRRRRRRELPRGVPERPSEPRALRRLEARAALHWVTEVLPPTEREVFVLRALHGYSGAETAARTGATVAAVKMAYSRARRRLRRALAEGGP
ncbi:MAG: RNA polymerase sigma factor [Sandaracinaceae bacterium]